MKQRWVININIIHRNPQKKKKNLTSINLYIFYYFLLWHCHKMCYNTKFIVTERIVEIYINAISVWVAGEC